MAMLGSGVLREAGNQHHQRVPVVWERGQDGGHRQCLKEKATLQPGDEAAELRGQEGMQRF